MMEWLGTEYGGWNVDLDLIPIGSVVLSAGVGEDISFDIELINRKGCVIYGIDPTQKAREYIAAYPVRNYHLIPKALWKDDTKIKMYRNKKTNEVSESIDPSDRGVDPEDWYITETISVSTLLKKHQHVSVLKMDIEGAEYEVLNNLTELYVPQLLVEFHHQYCEMRSEKDTEETIEHVLTLGYKIGMNHPHGISFIRIR